jgi:hypothetical protein
MRAEIICIILAATQRSDEDITKERGAAATV